MDNEMDYSGEAGDGASKQDAQAHIIKLDQKLRGLRAEIDAKAQSMASGKGDHPADYRQRLELLAEEVDKAIQGIETLVNLTTTGDALGSGELMGDELTQFNALIAEHLNKLSKMKETF